MTERVVAAFVPLVDCAVLVAAREQGFAAAAGLDLVLVKEPSWASLRDHLCLGHVDCAHALAPLPVAADARRRAGAGRLHRAVRARARRQRHDASRSGCSREMQRRLPRRASSNPAEAGRALAAVVRRRASAADARHGISVLEPQLRLALLARGRRRAPGSRRAPRRDSAAVDGRQLAAPGSSTAFASASRGTASPTRRAWAPSSRRSRSCFRVPSRRCSRCARVRRATRERSPKLLQALDAAAAWVDDPANHAELAALPRAAGVSRRAAGASSRQRSAAGCGSARARKLHDPDFIYFHRHAANAPRAADGLWAYAQMVRWGQLAPSRARRARRRTSVSSRPLSTERANASVDGAPLQSPFDRIEFSSTNVPAYLDSSTCTRRSPTLARSELVAAPLCSARARR